MKAGDAVIAHLAAALTEPRHDLTLVFYDCEEVEAARNGLGRIEREHAGWLLRRPRDPRRAHERHGRGRVPGHAAGRDHHPRAAGALGAVLAGQQRRARRGARCCTGWPGYEAREVDIDGCRYREGLQAVRIAGGVAGNVVPDECVVTVNFRFAPDRDADAAMAHVREVFDGFELAVTDLAPGALPGLGEPAAQEFLAASGTGPRAKYGWTDVARFAALGIPALNYGPGDPNLAHTREEHVDTRQITEAAAVLRRFLAS